MSEQLKPKNKAIAVTNDQDHLPATSAPSKEIDPFEGYANEVAPQNIIGALLKFSKGDYLAGRDNDVIPVGSKFTAAMDMMMVGFIKWRDNRPVKHVLVRIIDGGPRPTRNDMGDFDKDTWELNLEGEPRDPWKPVNYLPLLDDQGRLYTLTISDKAGLREVGGLAMAYAKSRKNHPHDYPQIVLKVDSYLHSDRTIGRVKYPKPFCVGWARKTDFIRALADAGLVPDDVVPPEALTVQAAPADEPKQVRQYPPDRISSGLPPDDGAPPHDHVPAARDFDDDIPF